MVLVRFEPLNPLTPRSRFWQSILCFLASYWGIPIFSIRDSGKLLGEFEAYKVVFADKLLGISHLEGLVVATSYWEIHIRGLAAGEFHFGRF